jgi:RNA polymerase sigma factor (sigma-70 family)
MYLLQLLSQFYQVKDLVKRPLLPRSDEVTCLAASAIVNPLDIGYEPMFFPSQQVRASSVNRMDDSPKNKMFEHWNHIEALTKRRFPDDQNRQLEASQYVLDALQADDWQKVRAFRGDNFTAFLTTVTSRLLTDFWYKQFGKQRPNRWLTRQTDSLYHLAYDLLVKDRYGKYEAIEILVTREPTRERWKIQEVVEAVLANCPIKEAYQTFSLDDEEGENYSDPSASLENQIEAENQEALLEILNQSLKTDQHEEKASGINQWLVEISQFIRLTEEECLLLKLRYQSGFTAKKIGTLLDLTGSQVDKRIKKILARLRQTLDREFDGFEFG